MYYLNENINQFDRVFEEYSRKKYLRLDLNENPGGLPNEFIQDILSGVDKELISEYPETLDFIDMLSKYIGTEAQNICLVNGSSEGIRYVIESFTSADGEIVGVTPSYAMFEVYAKMYGRKYIPVEYTSKMEMSIERIFDKINRNTQLLILVNPNNPVGNVYSEDEFKSLLKKVTELEITLLIDEAYHYFYPETFVKYAINNKRVLISRTFSKLFSLAGVRLGYIVGNKEDIEILKKMCTPRNINAFALLCARKMIENKDIVNELINNYREGRSYLEKKLKQYNYSFLGENGNFIFIKPNTDAETIVYRMREEKGILIKSYSGLGDFGECLRVTIAEKKYMERFLSALIEIDAL